MKVLNGIAIILFLSSSIFLIVGLINPKLVIRWGKKKNRIQVVAIFIISFIILGIFAGRIERLEKERALKNPGEVTSLRFSGERLKEIPKDFKPKFSLNQFKNLTKLDLSSNEFEKFPNEIINCTSIKILDIDDNKIRELPDSFSNFINLEELDLSSNNFEKFPKAILNCESIKKLNLENNKIDSIPDSIINLKKLQILNLNFNPIVEVPEWIFNMKNLKEINLRASSIEYLSSEIKAKLKSGQLKIDFKFSPYYYCLKEFPDSSNYTMCDYKIMASEKINSVMEKPTLLVYLLKDKHQSNKYMIHILQDNVSISSFIINSEIIPKTLTIKGEGKYWGDKISEHFSISRKVYEQEIVYTKNEPIDIPIDIEIECWLIGKGAGTFSNYKSTPKAKLFLKK